LCSDPRRLSPPTSRAVEDEWGANPALVLPAFFFGACGVGSGGARPPAPVGAPASDALCGTGHAPRFHLVDPGQRRRRCVRFVTRAVRALPTFCLGAGVNFLRASCGQGQLLLSRCRLRRRTAEILRCPSSSLEIEASRACERICVGLARARFPLASSIGRLVDSGGAPYAGAVTCLTRTRCWKTQSACSRPFPGRVPLRQIVGTGVPARPQLVSA